MRNSPDDRLLDNVIHALRSAGLLRGRITLGLSGGVDSMVLLNLLATTRLEHPVQIHALHVNHQLSPRADQWARLCAERCAELSVEFQAVRVTVQPCAGESLEAIARDARYAYFRAQAVDAVALAHQMDDQAETLLLQLLRGAGAHGLAAMPVVRVLNAHTGLKLIRPLLYATRGDIEVYAKRHALRWADDESNADVKFDRNYLRHRVLPLITERFPGYRQTWLRASRNLGDLADLVDEVARADASGALQEGNLRIAALRDLTLPRARNLVRWHLAQHGFPMPGRERLDEALRQLLEARPEAQPCVVLGPVQLARHRGQLLLMPTAPAPPAGWQIAWRGEDELNLPPGLGRLRFDATTGAGVSQKLAVQSGFLVRGRLGGERMKLAPNRPSRTLKNLLQEAGIPHWRRERMPLLCIGPDIVWAAGVGLDCRFAAQPDEGGLSPHWIPADSNPE
jgi:tRNA(Ile)-lysidine synthase